MSEFKNKKEWLITPLGEIKGFDGREYFVDGELIIKNALTDILIDINHEDKEAAGWIDKESLKIKDNGLYGVLELNEFGKELVDGKKYRFLSPTFIMDQDKKRVLSVDSVGLVNKLNILFKALNKKEIGEDMTKAQAEQKQDNSTKEIDEQNSATGTIIKSVDALSATAKALEQTVEKLIKSIDSNMQGELKQDNSAKEEDGDPKSENENLKKEIENLKKEQNSTLKEIKEISKKLGYFGGGEYERNSKSEGLSEDDKDVIDSLSIKEEDYLNTKRGK